MYENQRKLILAAVTRRAASEEKKHKGHKLNYSEKTLYIYLQSIELNDSITIMKVHIEICQRYSVCFPIPIYSQNLKLIHYMTKSLWTPENQTQTLKMFYKGSVRCLIYRSFSKN